MAGRPTILVTIDTEEDDWGSYAPFGAAVENISRVPKLHELLGEYGVRPTYFVNYPPLLHKSSLDVLRSLRDDPTCEIATHCHPWNTPPFAALEEELVSMMCNLSVEANHEKLSVMTETLEEKLGVRPVSFRAGRWGFGPSVAMCLPALGYCVDSSVSPFVDWSRLGGPDYSQAPFQPYRFQPEAPLVPDATGPLVEIPTTVGFLRGDQSLMATTRRQLLRSPLRRVRLLGILDRLGLICFRWLSPETSTTRDLTRLSESIMRGGSRVLAMAFHSSTLLPGATPFVASNADLARFLDRIRRILAFWAEQEAEFVTVGELGASIGAPLPPATPDEVPHRDGQPGQYEEPR